ncbi:MAG TPA: trypsin-like peptidase domain-containing protein [Candidatus Dormibacteraeota bacterium]|nr:trypsin-like peptidase domain-containing protein [Candidatus Dormibacteraeota bacterium]
MRDPFTPDFIETPIAPEPAAPVPPVQPSQPVPPFPHRPARSMAVAMLAAGLVAGSIGGGAVGALLASNRHTASTTTSPGTVAAGVAAPAPSPGSFAAIYQQVKDGVVTITTSVSGTGPRSFSQAEGSGIVVDKQGDILTNAHVVDSASQVQVTFSDGHTATGQVKGVDQSADLAVVQVAASDQLHPLTAGNSDALQVGDSALAIGSPFGLQGSLTAGIISGLNRSSTAPTGRALTGMIQTDAPINPGNSGGALLDANGKLIGINDSIQSPVEGNVGVGFAIPINRAESLLPSLEKGIAIQHPALGITAQTLTASTASQLGITGQTSGVLVIAAAPGGPAAAAGLHGTGQADASDDIITAIDGHPIATVDQLTQYLDTKKVGDRVTLSVTRNGQHISVGVTLGNFQAQPSATP